MPAQWLQQPDQRALLHRRRRDYLHLHDCHRHHPRRHQLRERLVQGQRHQLRQHRRLRRDYLHLHDCHRHQHQRPVPPVLRLEVVP